MPATKTRPKKNAERLKVLEEFGFALATPTACAIADALIEARKDAARFKSMLDLTQGDVVDALERTMSLIDTEEVAPIEALRASFDHVNTDPKG